MSKAQKARHCYNCQPEFGSDSKPLNSVGDIKREKSAPLFNDTNRCRARRSDIDLTSIAFDKLARHSQTRADGKQIGRLRYVRVGSSARGQGNQSVSSDPGESEVWTD